MAFPVNLQTQAGDPLYPAGFGQIRSRGPYINSLGHRYIFSDPFPVVTPHIIGAYRSTDTGQTWFEQDSGSHIVTYRDPFNPGASQSNCVSPHPTNPAIVTVFYFSDGALNPPIVVAQDFNIETNAWGATYGGAFPFVSDGGLTFPELFNVIVRPVANEFLVMASNSDGTHERVQFVRLSPGAGWGPTIDAFPGAMATDSVENLANASMACTTDENVYGIVERVNTGSSTDDLIQCILSPLNVVSNALIDAAGIVFPTNPLGAYSDTGGYAAASGKIFLALGFIPTVGTRYVYGGWATQGGTIAFPYNLGTGGIISGAGDAENVTLSVNYGSVVVWWNDAAFSGQFVTIAPAVVTPTVSAVTPMDPPITNASRPNEAHDMGSSLVGIIASTVGNSDQAYWEFTFGGASLSLTGLFLSGQVGLVYSTTFTASGGSPPYTYTISIGSLPVGLLLNPSTGVISGIPTVSGVFCFTVTVTDSAAATTSIFLAASPSLRQSF